MDELWPDTDEFRAMVAEERAAMAALCDQQVPALGVE